MNYYAVKATQARAYLWRGDKDSALMAAIEVLEAPLVVNNTLFRWTSQESIFAVHNPDLTFSTEVIFGIHSRNMYTNFFGFFSPALLVTSALEPLPERLNEVYENDRNDWRYTRVWTDAGGDRRILARYQPPTTDIFAIPAEYFQPLIRIPELYYIAAECLIETNPGKALEYMNVVRLNRGLLPLANPATLQAEIRKEYEKEFYGEGYLFYYYKRHNITSLPSARSETGSVSPAYRLPLPENEQKAR
jgi:hypothetical protein